MSYNDSLARLASLTEGRAAPQLTAKPSPSRGGPARVLTSAAENIPAPGPKASRTERRLWGLQVLDALHWDIATITRGGVGAGVEEWERVGVVSGALLDRLKDYEEAGTDTAKAAVRSATRAVLHGWRELVDGNPDSAA